MDKAIIEYVCTNAFLGEPIYISSNLGAIKCPKICDLHGDFIYYVSNAIYYCNLYDENSDKFLYYLLERTNKDKNNEPLILDFTKFAFKFYDADNFSFLLENNLSIIFKKNVIEKIDDEKGEKKDVIKENIIGVIDSSNISLFMDILKTIHFLKNDDYLDEEDENESKIAKEMKARIREERKKLQKTNSQKDNIGLLDVLSAVTARHPSINPLNVDQLNYYQVMQEFNQLMKIDNWNVNMMALTNGNISKEGQQNIKHYISHADD